MNTCFSNLKDKKIIFVTNSLKQLGGSERQALHLGNYLRNKEKAEVKFLGFDCPGRVAEICEEYGIQWCILPLADWINTDIQLLKSCMKLGSLLRKKQPDIILSYLTYANILCGFVWRFTGAQLYIWNQRNPGNEPFLRRSRLSVYLTPHFISNSSIGADFLTRGFRVNPNHIKVIYNGIELPEPEMNRMMWRRQFEISDNDLVGCMVANLSHFKDHITLLKAWKIVVKRLEIMNRRAILLLAGSYSDMYYKLKLLVFDLELDKNVKFLNHINDISGLLTSVDFGVFTSNSEGCPNGVLECMATGLAVAGTDIPGIREAVGPDGYPFLAYHGNAEMLADRILKLADNPSLRQKLGEANRRRVHEKFSLHRMCEETVAFIADKLKT